MAFLRFRAYSSDLILYSIIILERSESIWIKFKNRIKFHWNFPAQRKIQICVSTRTNLITIVLFLNSLNFWLSFLGLYGGLLFDFLSFGWLFLTSNLCKLDNLLLGIHFHWRSQVSWTASNYRRSFCLFLLFLLLINTKRSYLLGLLFLLTMLISSLPHIYYFINKIF